MRLSSGKHKGIDVFEVLLSEDSTETHLRELNSELAAKADFAAPAVVDLSRVDFLTSDSLGRLVAASRKFHNGGGRLVLCGLGPRLAETLHIVRLDRILALRLCVDSAVEPFLGGEMPPLDQLVAGNPTAEEVRAYWRERSDDLATPTVEAASALRRTAEAYRQGNGGHGHDKPIRPGASFDPEDLTPSPWASDRGDLLADWTEALLLFSKAQGICQRHGIHFSADLSFREFLERLSESLRKAEQ